MNLALSSCAVRELGLPEVGHHSSDGDDRDRHDHLLDGPSQCGQSIKQETHVLKE